MLGPRLNDWIRVLKSVRVVSIQDYGGMSGRVEDVVTGGSTAFKVKERQQQALGIVGLTDASGFLELGQKRVDSTLAPL